MRIIVDLDKKTLSVTSATSLVDPSSPTYAIGVQQGDKHALQLVLVKDGEACELPSPYTVITIGAVPKLVPTSDLLFFAESFTVTGSGVNAVYSSPVNFDTTEIADYLDELTVTEETTVEFDALIQVRLSDVTEDNKETVSGLWPVSVARDILENSTPSGSSRVIGMTWRNNVTSLALLKAVNTTSLTLGHATVVLFSTLLKETASIWVLTSGGGGAEVDGDLKCVPTDRDIGTNNKVWIKQRLQTTENLDALSVNSLTDPISLSCSVNIFIAATGIIELLSNSNATLSGAATTLVNGAVATMKTINNFASFSVSDATKIATISAVNGTNITGGNVTFTQNSVIPFRSNETGALVNTLVLNAGKVGIGTATPTETLQVVNGASSYTGFAVKHSGASGGDFMFAVTSAAHPFPSGFGIYNNTTASYSMFVKANGNIGIGTQSPSEQLEVYKSAASGPRSRLTNGHATSRNSTLQFCYGATPSVGWQFGADAAGTGTDHFFISSGDAGTYKNQITITTAGDVGFGTATPVTGGTSKIVTISNFGLAGGVTGVYWQNVNAAADNKNWNFLTNGTSFEFQVVNDAISSSTVALKFTRSGDTVQEVQIPTALLRLSNIQVDSVQSLTGAGAISITTKITKLTTSGASQALTLANGQDGQEKIIIHEVDGGSAVLTPTTKTGYTTITFTIAGDSATLRYCTTRGWMITALRGAVAA